MIPTSRRRAVHPRSLSSLRALTRQRPSSAPHPSLATTTTTTSHPTPTRLLSSSARTSFARSPALAYPRWINDKPRGNGTRGGAAAREKGEQEAEEQEQEERKAADATEVGGSRARSEARRLAEKDGQEGEGGAPPPAGSAGGASSSSSSDPPQSGNGNGDSGSSSSSNSITRVTPPTTYPRVLALPITRRPLFPGFYKAVVIKNPAVVAAIKEMMKRGQPYLGAFLLKDSESDADVIESLDAVEPVGVFAQITSVFPANNSGGQQQQPGAEESLTAVLYPHRRIRIDELFPPGVRPDEGEGELPKVEVAKEGEAKEAKEENEQAKAEAEEKRKAEQSHPLQTGFLSPYAVSLVNVTHLPPPPTPSPPSQTTRALMSELISVFKDIAQLNPLFRDQIANFSVSQSASNIFEEPDKLADFAAAVSQGEVGELQAVLESMDVEERLGKALVVLKKELINAQLQSKISREVESKIQKRQREYYLMEQLKGIKKELGIESDGKDKMLEKFKAKAESLLMPEAVRKVFDEEISKLSHLEQASSEFAVTRNYLDWLTSIPWGQHSPENFSLPHATTVLDEDHYGLLDVKDRILEFLAVGKLRGTVEGKILCFVGPPGVGKTSIGKSIARALGRQFFRFSVGGLTDVAEIKGHRRTYVGAMPGKIIQALKKVQTENPLVLIDEVDKIGRGHNGDPSSALLEMLDPEQNTAFLDHYMDVPVDLSRVLFVCTANMLDTIPAPLLDRMEVLEVSGYVAEEKAAIASRYLSPQAKEASGLKDADVQITPEAVESLIRYYARESGVRNLKKHIEKIYRKAALKIVQDVGEDKLPEEAAQPETITDAQGKPKTVEQVDGSGIRPPSETPSAPPQQPPASSTPSSESEPSSSEPSTPSSSSTTLSDFFSPNSPSSSSTASPSPPSQPALEPTPAAEERRKPVTTAPRKPLAVPADVHVQITPENLKDYVGPPVYQKDRLYVRSPPAGVSTGLGYLGNGSGAVMPIEATIMPGKGNLQLTGKLGEVIRESAQIALSWVKANAYDLGITKSEGEMMLQDRDIHLHMPEGAIGKDGPSAGTAILTAFVSLLTKTKVDPDTALTGEVTLVGQVAPVGGLKEKILAANRAGMKRLLVPAGCRADIEYKVPDSVKAGIEILYVEEAREVLKHVFGKEPIADRWRERGLIDRDDVVQEVTQEPVATTASA